MATLEQVARAAGVSTSTASRALSRPDMVASATRDRVIALAAEMGLTLNPWARTLITGRTNAIGVIAPTLTNPYYAPMIHGIQRALAVDGAHALLGLSEGHAAGEAVAVHDLAAHVDSLVFLSPRAGDEVYLRLAETTRLVTINHTVADIPSVTAGTPAGVGRLIDALARLGHRRILYISGPQALALDLHRQAVARERADAAGIRLQITPPVSPTLEAGMDFAARWAEHAEITAVVAYSSFVALGLVTGLREAGMAVPADLSVAAADQLAAIGTRGGSMLTALDIPLEGMGFAAGRILMTGVEPGTSSHVSMPTTLLRGRTIDRPAPDGVART